MGGVWNSIHLYFHLRLSEIWNAAVHIVTECDMQADTKGVQSLS